MAREGLDEIKTILTEDGTDEVNLGSDGEIELDKPGEATGTKVTVNQKEHSVS